MLNAPRLDRDAGKREHRYGAASYGTTAQSRPGFQRREKLKSSDVQISFFEQAVLYRPTVASTRNAARCRGRVKIATACHCWKSYGQIGGDGETSEDKEAEAEAEQERLEALREAEERRKEKHRRMEEEREKMRQQIRDKADAVQRRGHVVGVLGKSGELSIIPRAKRPRSDTIPLAVKAVKTWNKETSETVSECGGGSAPEIGNGHRLAAPWAFSFPSWDGGRVFKKPTKITFPLCTASRRRKEEKPAEVDDFAAGSLNRRKKTPEEIAAENEAAEQDDLTRLRNTIETQVNELKSSIEGKCVLQTPTTTTQSKAARDGGGHRAAFPGPPARTDTLFFAQRLAPSKTRALPAAVACRGRARRHATKDTKLKYNGRAPAKTRLQPVPPVVFPSAARLNRPLAHRGAASQRAPPSEPGRLPLHRPAAGPAGRTADHVFASRRSPFSALRGASAVAEMLLLFGVER
ncbi:hypothetical protein HPB49_005469 [Dermacentor silvarum]|uniref:Uncharacterized protein n=1 Tax=Dermacentor silvarum TaxID=543639 RepID=A0ACB8DV69_DERSI|nr:hypothetical protein HPB49_005469 [Dermacentor silvarum]